MALRLLCNAVVRSGGPKIGRATLPAANAPALAGKICGADLKAAALPLLPKGGAALGTSARAARVCPGKSPATTPATAGPLKADQGAVSGLSWFAGTSPRPTSGAAAGTKISADVQAAIPPSIYNTSAAKAAQISTFQAVGVTWIAGSCQKTLKALIPFPAKHSPSRLFSTKASEAATKPGQRPLGYFRVVCALTGGAAGAWLCVSGRAKNGNQFYDQLGILPQSSGEDLLGILPQKPNGYKPVITAEDFEEDDLPDFIDWEEEGILTPVVDDPYGICWAIAPTHSVEAAFAIETGRVVELSIQQVVDWGMNGGLPLKPGTETTRMGFLHITFKGIAKFGLTTQEAYPLASNQKDRQFELAGKPIIARIEGAEPIRNTEKDFMRALQKQPIAVYMFSSDAFDGHYWDDSVLTIEQCPPGDDVPSGVGKVISNVDHCVLLVGYGTDKSTGRKYWKIKNSHGDEWGFGGYGRIERGGSDWRGAAGITSHWGFRPIISKQR